MKRTVLALVGLLFAVAVCGCGGGMASSSASNTPNNGLSVYKQAQTTNEGPAAIKK